MPLSQIALGLGTIAVIGIYAVGGRAAATLITATWGGATAYLLMTPIYSFRISKRSDLIAMVLYGAVGLVLSKTVQKEGVARRLAGHFTPPDPGSVNLATVLAEVMSSPDLATRFQRAGVSLDPSGLRDFRCLQADGGRVLSDVLTAVLGEPEIGRVSFHVARRPGEALLFVNALPVTRPPGLRTITIGGLAASSPPTDFPEWPKDWSATRFDTGYGAVYQISLKPDPLPAAPDGSKKS